MSVCIIIKWLQIIQDTKSETLNIQINNKCSTFLINQGGSYAYTDWIDLFLFFQILHNIAQHRFGSIPNRHTKSVTFSSDHRN